MLTIDDDRAAKLKAEMRRSGQSMNEVVNDHPRRGLNAKRGFKLQKPFKFRSRMLNLRGGLDYENVGDLLEQLEGPSHR